MNNVRVYTDYQLKIRGFRRHGKSSLWTHPLGHVASYGLIVVVRTKGAYYTSDNFHNFSRTTSKQVTKATGISSGIRKACMEFLEFNKFTELCEQKMKTLEVTHGHN